MMRIGRDAGHIGRAGQDRADAALADQYAVEAVGGAAGVDEIVAAPAGGPLRLEEHHSLGTLVSLSRASCGGCPALSAFDLDASGVAHANRDFMRLEHQINLG